MTPSVSLTQPPLSAPHVYLKFPTSTPFHLSPRVDLVRGISLLAICRKPSNATDDRNRNHRNNKTKLPKISRRLRLTGAGIMCHIVWQVGIRSIFRTAVVNGQFSRVRNLYWDPLKRRIVTDVKLQSPRWTSSGASGLRSDAVASVIPSTIDRRP